MNRMVFLTLSVMGGMTAVAQTDSINRELREIVVTANQPATRLVGSTLVTTIAGSGLDNLGTALDVLGQLPMLSVDADGSVSVTGRGTPEIFIDGHPVGDISDLKRLRSENLSKVELMLSPGAMYESETRAVLKISTRRNFIDGLSLNETAEGIVRRRFSASDALDLNYHLDRWDFFVNSGVAYNNSLMTGRTLNSLTFAGQPIVIGSSQHSEMPSLNGGVKVGANYVNGTQSFGFYWRYHPEKGDYLNRGAEWIDDETPLNRSISRRIRAQSHLLSAYFEQKFHEKYLFHFDGSFRSGNAKNNVKTTYLGGEIDDVASRDSNNSTLVAVKAYLTFPLWRGDLSVGTQDSYTRSSLDYRMLNADVSEYIPSTLTDARQIATAAFASWGAQFGKLNIGAGLRYEFTDYLFNVNGRKDANVCRRFHSLTPDLSLGWQFNDRAQVSLTYKSLTVKPPYAQLTGSLSYVGRYEIEGGNPLLRDEKRNNIQMFAIWRDFMFQADWVRSKDAYGYTKRLQESDDLHLIMSPINLDISSLSCYLIWNRRVRWWTPEITAGMYRQWVNLDGQTHSKPMFSYYFDNTFALPWNLTATLNFNGHSSGDMSTNRFAASWFSVDASIAKSFLNNSLHVNITASDIFNTLNPSWSMHTFGVDVDKRQRYDLSGVTLTVTYSLRPRRVDYKGKSASDSELRRL